MNSKYNIKRFSMIDFTDEIINEDIRVFDEFGNTKRNSPIFKMEKYFNFGQFLRFDLLGKAKLDDLRYHIVEEYVIVKQKKTDKKIKGRLLRIRPVKIKNHQFYTLTLMTKNGEKTITVNEKDSFKVKIPKMSKFDPYGEEDWDVYSTEKPVSAGKAGPKEIKPKKLFVDLPRFAEDTDEEKRKRRENVKKWIEELVNKKQAEKERKSAMSRLLGNEKD
jgi:hypothetical protein